MLERVVTAIFSMLVILTIGLLVYGIFFCESPPPSKTILYNDFPYGVSIKEVRVRGGYLTVGWPSEFFILQPDGSVIGDRLDRWSPLDGWSGDEFGEPITASVENLD